MSGDVAIEKVKTTAGLISSKVFTTGVLSFAVATASDVVALNVLVSEKAPKDDYLETKALVN